MYNVYNIIYIILLCSNKHSIAYNLGINKA